MRLPHEHRICGARNREGKPCRRVPALGRNRCNLHGGKSPRGKDHPRYVHGYYTIEERKKRRFLRELIMGIKKMF